MLYSLNVSDSTRVLRYSVTDGATRQYPIISVSEHDKHRTVCCIITFLTPGNILTSHIQTILVINHLITIFRSKRAYIIQILNNIITGHI